MTAGLYIHIPFCHARCGYCDFATFIGKEDQFDPYLKALLSEMTEYTGSKLNTLFIGGGTPTVLSSKQIRMLFKSIHMQFDLSNLKEATVEANPESASQDNLKAFKQGGINRISFGVQASQNHLLKKMDRLHTWETFIDKYKLARDLGFNNINIDLIFGLPGQTNQDWEETLKTVLDLNPEHVSLYALKVETGTPFDRDGVKIDDDLQADMYLAASEKLGQAGYNHYEISNFCKPGKESAHNLRYWKNDETIGLGVSAASYINKKRRTNTRSLTEYLNQIHLGQKPVSSELELNENKNEKENIMLGLRLKQGVDFGSIKPLNIPEFYSFLDYGLATLKEGRYSLTPQGWLLSNQLFQYLI